MTYSISLSGHLDATQKPKKEAKHPRDGDQEAKDAVLQLVNKLRHDGHSIGGSFNGISVDSL